MNGKLIIDSFAGGGGASTGIELALWIAPELDPDAVRTSKRVYFLAFAVAIFAAFLIWDASAGATLPGRTVSMKAGAASW